MNCINCHQAIQLDASIIKKYPEWQLLKTNKKKQSSSISKAAHAQSISTGSSKVYHHKSSVGSSTTSSTKTKSMKIDSRFRDRRSIESSSSDGISGDCSVVHDPGVPPSSSTLGQEITMAGNLFDIIRSDETALDHPMCQECTNKLLDAMDAQLTMLEDECSEYRALLDNLDECEEELDMNCLKTELEKLQNEEASMRTELARLEIEETGLEDRLKQEETKLDGLIKKDETLWKQFRNDSRQLVELESDKQSLENQLQYAETQLDKLQRTNVFNLCFHIWYSGQFGTINELRLGRLPSVTVEWPEINAAWGQTVLLLVSLARKMNLKFQDYELVPFGNHSYVKSLNDGREFPLYCTGGYKFFWDTKFDTAMVSFLNCLEQLKCAIEKGDHDFCMPYKMNKDKIVVQDVAQYNEYSVKIQFNSEERWTKAMKCMLTNLKWALAWVESLQS